MFQIVSMIVFLGISVFLHFFGMHLMKQLDRYMNQRKKKRDRHEESTRGQNNGTTL